MAVTDWKENGKKEVRYCRKCLLVDMPEEAYFKTLRQYIENLDEELKVEEEIYRQRLLLCRQCENLLSGMCRLCGCFVELRAVMKKNACPMVRPAWESIRP